VAQNVLAGQVFETLH